MERKEVLDVAHEMLERFEAHLTAQGQFTVGIETLYLLSEQKNLNGRGEKAPGDFRIARSTESIPDISIIMFCNEILLPCLLTGGGQHERRFCRRGCRQNTSQYQLPRVAGLLTSLPCICLAFGSHYSLHYSLHKGTEDLPLVAETVVMICRVLR